MAKTMVVTVLEGVMSMVPDPSGVQGMKESYKLYGEQLMSQLADLGQGVQLASSTGSAHKHVHLGERPLDTATKASSISTDAAALVSAMLQWLVLLVLSLMVYCWWHRVEPRWSLPPAMVRWLRQWNLPSQPLL